MDTLFLLPATWDLTVDALGNIAMAAAPYALAQDAASAIRTFAGECWYDTTLGLPYWTQVLGESPPLSLLRAQLTDAALTVPGVVAAVVYFTGFTERVLLGQVQVRGPDGATAATAF